MRDELAEALLAKVLNWSDAEKASERALLQDLARYKYDEYQQYAPGRRFIESLALWLRQFATLDERRAAYEFVRQRVIFISTPEIRHLVELAFPTAIRPRLIAKAAAVLNVSALRCKHVVASSVYSTVLRQTLFLGLSDGARTDVFRRAHPVISNEQLWHAYDISDGKASSMGKKLTTAMKAQLGRDPTEEESSFHTVCLLDDFTASGTSYIRRDAEGKWDGKIPRILEKIAQADSALSKIVRRAGVEVLVCIYVAADQAVQHIRTELANLDFPNGTVALEVVHALPPSAKLDDTRDTKIIALANNDRYFDPDSDDEHSEVGGTSSRLGYAGCRLPLVLSHNTPNNSIYLLRGEYDQTFTGLFPRVSRHKRGG
ncbi:hypothetical protein MXD81_53695 [Microbacteriaceae bacterium K1510]|nr:hypothetical protein [Microbacteriaceae bacterium K1510]